MCPDVKLKKHKYERQALQSRVDLMTIRGQIG
jgi:hypothetical protein